MADTPDQGGLAQPGTEPAPGATEPQPGTEPAPGTQQATPTPQHPKYGGKSAEELARLLDEKDQFISEQSRQAAQAKHDAEYFKALSEQSGQAGVPFQAPPQPVPAYQPPYPSPYGPGPTPQPGARPGTMPFDPKQVVTEQEYVNDPVAATAKIQMAFYQYQQAVEAQNRAVYTAEQAKRNFVVGRKAALEATPALYEGIEQAVQDSVVQAYREKLISTEQLLDQKTWQLAAKLIRMERGEEDFGRYLRTGGPTPVAPGFQQVPGQRTATGAQTTLTPEQREMVQLWGQDESKFTKALEKNRSEGAEY